VSGMEKFGSGINVTGIRNTGSKVGPEINHYGSTTPHEPYALVRAVDPDSLNPDTDPDPAFQVNPDPDPGF
jgi:hypothetical protein